MREVMGMDSPPEEPQVKKNRQGLMSGAQWLKEHVLAAPDSAITSLGEFLLPALLGAMESCWIAAVLIGLAGTGFLGLHVPLIPIWGLFLYLVGSQALLYYLELRTTGKAAPGKEESETTVDARLFFVLTGVMCLLLVWLQIYSSTAFLLNPRWVGSLISDILFLNIHFYQILGIIVFSFFLCWRGLQLASRRIEPSSVFRVLCIGLGVIIAVILLRAELESAGAVFHDDIFLLLLIPVFLLLALAAHALARIAFVRRTHPIGLQGSVIAQERAVIGVIGSIGIVLLLLSLVVGLFASPAFLRDICTRSRLYLQELELPTTGWWEFLPLSSLFLERRFTGCSRFSPISSRQRHLLRSPIPRAINLIQNCHPIPQLRFS